MRLAELFVLRIGHDFYADGRCRDFAVDADPATARLLRNHRCLLKPTVDGARVLMEIDKDAKPVLPFPEDTRFSFELRLESDEFASFTDLREILSKSRPTYTNAGSSDEPELVLEERTSRVTERIEDVEIGSNVEVVLANAPLEGAAATDFVVESPESVSVVAYDAELRQIALDTSGIAPGSSVVLRYPVEGALAAGVLANVEIVADDSFPAQDQPLATAATYPIAFQASASRWAYYCVTDLEVGAADIRIQDSASSNPVIFGNANRIDLAEHPTLEDEIARQLSKSHPKARRFRLVSDSAVPCRQAVRKLKLTIKDEPFHDSLPNPPNRNQARIAIGSDRHESFFHVFRYLTDKKPT